MATQAPPGDAPARGVSQLYPNALVPSMESQAPPGDAPARGVSQLYPSDNQPPHVSTIRAPSKTPSSVTTGQSRQPSVRPSQTPYSQATVRPSHAATLRGASQAPSHQPSVRPSHAATLRGPSQAPTRGASQHHTTSSQIPGCEPSMRPNHGATELRRDVSRQPTIVLQPPSNHPTLLQRDSQSTTRQPVAQPTLLQRDQSRMPSAMPAIKEATITPVIGPSKKFENLPSVRSILNSPADIQMASRQPTINQLQGAEREAQEEWAEDKLSKLDTGCPQNYGWSRRGDGYLCDGGSHYITDALLAEGMGGLFAVKNKHDWQNRSQGPYYLVGKNEEGKNLFQKIDDPKMG